MSMDLYSRFGSSIARMRQSVAQMNDEQNRSDERDMSKETLKCAEEAKIIPISAGREKEIK